jgi:hypothetical protein
MENRRRLQLGFEGTALTDPGILSHLDMQQKFKGKREDDDQNTM